MYGNYCFNKPVPGKIVPPPPQKNKNIINATAINHSSVYSNCACPGRCRMFIVCLDLRLVTAHMRRLVRTYLVRIFPRKGLSTWCKTNLFFFNSRKTFPTKALNRTDNTRCQKLATKIKAFQSAFEVRDLAANGTCRQVTLLT